MQNFIPYTHAEEDFEYTINPEAEVAIAYLQSIRDGDERLEEIIKIHYPFMVYTSEENQQVFDLLGLSKTEKHLLAPNDISDLLSKLLEGDSDRLSLLDKCKSSLSEENYISIIVDGLVDQNDIIEYLKDADSYESDSETELFQPIFTSKKFSAMKRKLRDAQKKTTERIDSIKEVKTLTQKLFQEVSLEHEKEHAVFKKESDKRLKKLEKEVEKGVKNADNTQKKVITTVNKEIDIKISSKQDEIDNTSKKIEVFRKKAEEGDRDARKVYRELEKALKQYKKEQNTFEEERKTWISEAEQQAIREKKEYMDKLQLQKQEETNLETQLNSVHETEIESILELVDLIAQVETYLTVDYETLSHIIEVKSEKGKTVQVPFYIYKSGAKYGYNVPIKVSNGKGVTKTLRLLLTGDLGQKIDQFIEPDTDSFNKLMETILEELSADSSLSKQYKKTINEKNLLGSHKTLDLVEVGLYQIYEWKWINDKDYIMIQRRLVEKMDSLNKGYVFNTPMELIQDTIVVTA